MAKSSTARSEGGKGKTRFLERNDALQLATTIASTQEEKAIGRSEKHTLTQRTESSKPPRKSTSKAKLLEIKARIASDRTKAKKKKRQQARSGPVQQKRSSSPSSSLDIKSTTGKRVSFV
ncbi:hypothetical protein VKT23_018742 [Stygiomarasmius scandens]|uniref:Uncharacterized protein n=1 Tax=Marasmiellus scandens TaxID=2682957 RepID=A0ABR1IPT7_9AGAR